MGKEITDEQIGAKFREYVESMEDTERHSNEACNAVDNYDMYVQEIFPHEAEVHDNLFEKMMAVAVEYEKSGFEAGFKVALAMIREQEQS